MGRVGLDCLSVFGLPPVQFIELAGGLSCSFVTLGLPVTCNPEGFPAYSFDDPGVRRDVKAALGDHDLRVRTAEGFFFFPGVNVESFARHLENMADIGAETINMVSLHKDLARSLDQFAILAEMSAAYGMSSSVEFVAGTVVGALGEAVRAVRHVGRADCKLVVDTLHLARSGGGAADILAVDPGLIGYVQLCDGPYKTAEPAYETLYERMRPGAGDLPLTDILSALPADIPVGLEVPQRSLAEAGVGPRERLGPCVAAAKALLIDAAERRLDRANASPGRAAEIAVTPAP